MINTTPRRLGLALAALAFAVAPQVAAQTVEKEVTASPYFQRSLWEITKTADASEVTLSCDQTFDVNYTVTVRKVARTGEHFPEGTIRVTNTTAAPVTITDLDDIVQASTNPAIQEPMDVTCPVAFPYVMAAGEVLDCTFEGHVLEPTEIQIRDLNEAIATFSGPVTASSGLIPFATQSMGQTDTCVHVEDDLFGLLSASSCPPAGTDAVFQYTMPVGPFGSSGVYNVVNTASFYGTDSGPGGAPDSPPLPGSASGEASWTVVATVECETGGCTLTQGYWKTHSEFGPAPYDNTWAELPGGLGASTLFLNTTVTWYNLFWTPPSGGNAYIQLAHQWMAATLNVLAGADAPAGGILATAQTLMTNNPGCRTGSCPASVRNQMRSLASTLDSYNNGTLPGGPEHCDGEPTAGARALVGDGATFALGRPMPNPTNGTSAIQFDVPEGAQVRMVVYDLTGREVAVLTDDYYETGTHEVVFDGGSLPAGTYIVRMSSGDFSDVTRIVLAR
jgi:hypothetical protein